jgi:hypothetical protein
MLLCKHIHANNQNARCICEQRLMLETMVERSVAIIDCISNYCSSVLKWLMPIEKHALMTSSVCSWGRIEVPVAHYLETRSFCWHAIHVL